MLLDGVDVDDVGVGERGGELGLAHEAFAERRLHRELGREDLDRDLAVEGEVLGEEDGAHAAAAELAGDLVPPLHRLLEQPLEWVGQRQMVDGRWKVKGALRVLGAEELTLNDEGGRRVVVGAPLPSPIFHLPFDHFLILCPRSTFAWYARSPCPV